MEDIKVEVKGGQDGESPIKKIEKGKNIWRKTILKNNNLLAIIFLN